MNSLVAVLLKALESNVSITILPDGDRVSYEVIDREHSENWRRVRHTFTAEELMTDLKDGGIPISAAEQQFNADLKSLLSVRPAPPEDPTDDTD